MAKRKTMAKSKRSMYKNKRLKGKGPKDKQRKSILWATRGLVEGGYISRTYGMFERERTVYVLLYDNTFFCMVICFILWQYVLLNGNMFCCMVVCSVVWQYVLLQGKVFCCMAICSIARKGILLYANTFFCMAICLAVWQYALLYGNVFCCMAMRSFVW
jgi:hypothetical protein